MEEEIKEETRKHHGTIRTITRIQLVEDTDSQTLASTMEILKIQEGGK